MLALTVGSLLLSAAARGDDWSQFRKDSRRSAASTDATVMPMVEVWSHVSRSIAPSLTKQRFLSMSTVAAGRGCVYFISREPAPHNNLPYRTLIGADARTGVPLWRQFLGDLEQTDTGVPEIGPLLLGTAVAAYDRAPVAAGVRSLPKFGIRVVRALDGAPLTFEPVDPGPTVSRATGGLVPQWALLRGHGGADQVMPNGAEAPPPIELTGHPLAVGDEILAATPGDVLFRAAPLRPRPGAPVNWSFRLSHPVTAMRYAARAGLAGVMRTFPPARLSGYPLAQAGAGLVVGEDQTDRFVALFEPGAGVLWHRDVPWTLGVPAVGAGGIFIGIGGASATHGITTFDLATGATRWTYSTGLLQADPVDVVLTGGGSTGDARSDRIRDDLLSAAAGRRKPTAGTRPGARGSGGGGVIGTFGPSAPSAPTPQPGAASLQPAMEARSPFPPGHLANPGLVVMKDRVYGVVGEQLVALEQESGRVAWSRALPPKTPVLSLAASREHLLACLPDRVFALRLDDGQLAWLQPVAVGGSLATAEGLVYLATGKSLHAFGPAERTFRIALDSSQSREFAPRQAAPARELEKEPAEEGAAPPDEEGKPDPPRTGQPPPTWLADARLLRLTWGGDTARLVRQAHERGEAGRGLPLLLSLDWLSPDRATPIGPPGGPEAPGWSEAFAAACAALAAAARPAYFDIGPEVNVYLARQPAAEGTVERCLDAARAAVRRASPETRVLISLNVEVLNGVYGQGGHLPFAKLPPRQRTGVLPLPGLCQRLDAVGLTSHPQSAYHSVETVPGSHFLGVRALLPDKPLLVTRLAVRTRGWPKALAGEQPPFLRRLLQLCYWLDAPMVAYPEVDADPPTEAAARSVPALGTWRDVPAWKVVKRLTLRARPADEAAAVSPDRPPRLPRPPGP